MTVPPVRDPSLCLPSLSSLVTQLPGVFWPEEFSSLFILPVWLPPSFGRLRRERFTSMTVPWLLVSLSKGSRPSSESTKIHSWLLKPPTVEKKIVISKLFQLYTFNLSLWYINKKKKTAKTLTHENNLSDCLSKIFILQYAYQSIKISYCVPTGGRIIKHHAVCDRTFSMGTYYDHILYSWN